MSDWLKWSIAGLAVAVLAFASLRAYGEWQWNSDMDKLRRQVMASSAKSPQPSFDANVLETLPAPVKRYLAKAITTRTAPVTSVYIRHTGTFNLSESGESWVNFSSDQYIVVDKPGFVWTATMPMMPLVPIKVVDAYVDGEGLLKPAIFGLFPLTELKGKGEIARGELMRYVAEAAWHPTSLLPGKGLSWTAIDNTNARVHFEDAGIGIDMVFSFGADDLVERVTVASRGRSVGGTIETMPWEGRFSDYREIDGLMVPMKGEVGWLTPSGYRPYWRGDITDIRFDDRPVQ